MYDKQNTNLIIFMPQIYRMTRSLLFFVCCTFTVFSLQGQVSQQHNTREDMLTILLEGGSSGKVNLEVDSLLVANYYKLLSQNKKVTGVPGYRIRIFSESGLGAKEEQQRVRARFVSDFPGVDAYHKYDEPFFKVYVGDCRTRSQALKLQDRIQKQFPNSFIVPDYVNIRSPE